MEPGRGRHLLAAGDQGALRRSVVGLFNLSRCDERLSDELLSVPQIRRDSDALVMPPSVVEMNHHVDSPEVPDVGALEGDALDRDVPDAEVSLLLPF